MTLNEGPRERSRPPWPFTRGWPRSACLTYLTIIFIFILLAKVCLEFVRYVLRLVKVRRSIRRRGTTILLY